MSQSVISERIASGLDTQASSGIQEEPAPGRPGLRLALAWGSVAVLLLALVSVFSGGFFLYAVLVVAGLLLASGALVQLSILELRCSRQLDSTEVPLGGQVGVHVELHNAKAWPALWLLWRDPVERGLDVEGSNCAFESLQGEGRGRFDYRLHTLRRGLFRLGPTMVEASGPFGLVKRFHVAADAAFVTVLPRSVPLGQGWPLGHRPIHQVPRRRSLFEDPSRFLGVRQYRPGDSLRRIHWRATARSGELQVKLYEPAVLDGLQLAVEMSEEVWRRHGSGEALGEQGNRRQELAITAALSLAEWVLGAGQSVSLLSNGGDAAERYAGDWTGGTFRRLEDAMEAAEGQRPKERRKERPRPVEVPASKGSWHADHLRTALARLTEAPGPNLGDLLRAELPRLSRTHVVMAVTPQLDASLLSALEALRRSGIEAAVLWITAPSKAGGRAGGPQASSVQAPAGLPVYAVADDSDLQVLGNTRL